MESERFVDLGPVKKDGRLGHESGCEVNGRMDS
jgi:hypothetical protein